MKKLFIASIIFIHLAFCIGWFVGERAGTKAGARQMARHILNPAFETDSFYAIMNEECGSAKGWIKTGEGVLIYKEGVTIDGRDLANGQRR